MVAPENLGMGLSCWCGCGADLPSGSRSLYLNANHRRQASRRRAKGLLGPQARSSQCLGCKAPTGGKMYCGKASCRVTQNQRRRSGRKMPVVRVTIPPPETSFTADELRRNRGRLGSAVDAIQTVERHRKASPATLAIFERLDREVMSALKAFEGVLNILDGI